MNVRIEKARKVKDKIDYLESFLDRLKKRNRKEPEMGMLDEEITDIQINIGKLKEIHRGLI